MATAETLSLIKTLKPRLGQKGAEELVTFIEETKSEHLATKADLKELEINIRKELHANMWKIFAGIGLLLSIFITMLKLIGA